MACHEIAALRLGLMQLLGIDDPAEREHELKELGEAASQDGPLRSLMQGGSLEQISRFFSLALVDLQEKVLQADADQRPYYNTLLAVTKKVEQDLKNQTRYLTGWYHDLDELHHFIHELYPAPEK